MFLTDGQVETSSRPGGHRGQHHCAPWPPTSPYLEARSLAVSSTACLARSRSPRPALRHPQPLRPRPPRRGRVARHARRGRSRAPQRRAVARTRPACAADRLPTPGPMVDLPSLARPRGQIFVAEPALRAPPFRPRSAAPRWQTGARARPCPLPFRRSRHGDHVWCLPRDPAAPRSRLVPGSRRGDERYGAVACAVTRASSHLCGGRSAPSASARARTGPSAPCA